MIELKNWHKFLAAGVIIIILIVASYLIISGIESGTDTTHSDRKSELQKPQSQASSNQPKSSSNLPPEVGQVASSTVIDSRGSKNDVIVDSVKPHVLEKSLANSPPTNSQNQESGGISAPPTTASASTPPPATTSSAEQAIVNELIASTAQVPQDASEFEAWQHFKTNYNKIYASEAEELKRRDIFRDNRKFILSFNEKRTAQFTLGVNQFADLTRDEINQLYFSQSAPAMSPPPSFRLTEQSDRLGQVDWRNMTREPVDQGTCRDSAVFAAVAAIESAFNRKFLPPVNIKLSEEQLIDCITQQSISSPNGQPACQGSYSMVQIFDLLQQRSYSLTTPEDYKKLVEMTGHKCEIPPDALNSQPPTKLAGYFSVHHQNIVEALYVSGPLCITIDASQSTFHFYQSGLYHDENCSRDTYNHHMLLVGHSSATDGDSNLPSFLLRNSFGMNWGESGYMRLLKDEQRNKCLPQYLAIYPGLAN